MYTFRAFHPVDDKETSEKFLRGHVKVLQDYGITNITSNTPEWMNWDNVYGVVVEDENNNVVGGIRIQIANGKEYLPVELAIGKIDARIHDIVKKYFDDGVGELCALWNAKEVAGLGLSLLLTRAGISMVNQVNCKTLMGICADYTMEMFNRVGFVVDGSLGDNGGFSYPNPNYIARVLGILNAKDLSTAFELDQSRMLDLRQNPNQIFNEETPKGGLIKVQYKLKLNLS